MALFDAGTYTANDGRTIQTEKMTVEDRIPCVKACDDAQMLRQALERDDLQATVRKAIERKLERLP